MFSYVITESTERTAAREWESEAVIRHVIVLFTFGVLGIDFKSAHMFEHLLYHKSTPLAKTLNKMSKQAGCCRYKVSLSVSRGVTEKLGCVFTAVSHWLQAGSGTIKAFHICRWLCWWQNELTVEKASRWSHSRKEMSRPGSTFSCSGSGNWLR